MVNGDVKIGEPIALRKLQEAGVQDVLPVNYLLNFLRGVDLKDIPKAAARSILEKISSFKKQPDEVHISQPTNRLRTSWHTGELNPGEEPVRIRRTRYDSSVRARNYTDLVNARKDRRKAINSLKGDETLAQLNKDIWQFSQTFPESLRGHVNENAFKLQFDEQKAALVQLRDAYIGSLKPGTGSRFNF